MNYLLLSTPQAIDRRMDMKVFVGSSIVAALNKLTPYGLVALALIVALVAVLKM